MQSNRKVPPLRQGYAGKKYEVIKIGIKITEAELKKRINKRIEKWFKQGLLKEVQNLHKKGLSWKRMTEIGLEYKLVANFLMCHLRKKCQREPLTLDNLKRKCQKKLGNMPNAK